MTAPDAADDGRRQQAGPAPHHGGPGLAILAAMLLAVPAAAVAEEAGVPAPPSAAGPESPPAQDEPPADVQPPAIVRPSHRHGATVAIISATTYARSRPGGRRRVWRVRPETPWAGQAQTLLVLRSERRRGATWLEVLLPTRPNGRTAWIHRDTAVLRRTPYYVHVSRRRREVRVYRSGRVVRRFRAVVGKPSTPTPRTLAAIYERVRQPKPKGFLGRYALHLTAHSKVLFDYDGGKGRVALHGRGGVSFRDPLGSARSHGCVRVTNRAITWMARRLPRGTPVSLR